MTIWNISSATISVRIDAQKGQQQPIPVGDAKMHLAQKVHCKVQCKVVSKVQCREE